MMFGQSEVANYKEGWKHLGERVEIMEEEVKIL
jgi:hypothetical protein